MISNIHKVPAALWRSFKSNHAREIFNVVLSRSARNQLVIIPPKMKLISDNNWYIICHNIACMTAWAIERKKLIPKSKEVIIKPKSKIKSKIKSKTK